MKKNVIIITILILIILILFIFEYYIYDLPDISVALNGKLNSVQTKAIDLLIDFTKLFITFALGILGGVSYFIKGSNKMPIIQTRFMLFSLILCITSAVLSIFFGHIIFIAVIEMLGNDFFDIFANIIVWATKLQYIFLLISITSLIMFVYKVNKYTIESSIGK